MRTGAADGDRYIPESDAISTYPLRKFDTQDKFGLNSGDWIRDEILNSLNPTTFVRSVYFILFIEFDIIRNEADNRFDGSEMREILTIFWMENRRMHHREAVLWGKPLVGLVL